MKSKLTETEFKLLQKSKDYSESKGRRDRVKISRNSQEYLLKALELGQMIVP